MSFPCGLPGAKMRIGRIVGAAFAYASSAFIIGFALGAIRVLFLAPRIGSTLAVSIEAPMMLAFSWAIMKWIGPRLALPATPAAMVVLGLLAFGLLQLYEFGLAIFVFGRTLRETSQALASRPARLVSRRRLPSV